MQRVATWHALDLAADLPYPEPQTPHPASSPPAADLRCAYDIEHRASNITEPESIQPSQDEPGRRTRRRRRWPLYVLIALIALLILAEGVARFGLGLGDPPLWQAHAQIEYIAVPSQRYSRYGNTISYNAYSMRSDEFPQHKQDRHELRVLFFGDSVINGGALTDQAELATEMIKVRLARELERPVVVGNVSAGSWGPPNLLAYARQFGFFDADVVVIVLSSHDHVDEPAFDRVVGPGTRRPEHGPIFALQELFTRFLPLYLRGRTEAAEPPPIETDDPAVVSRVMTALRDLIRLARQRGARVIVAQHATFPEVQGKQLPGHAAIQTAATIMGIEPVQCLGAFQEALRDEMPYRDRIHPNELGQRLLADTLYEPILNAASRR